MSLFAWLGWALFGFVVGLLSRALFPARDPLGLLGATWLGIAGAVLWGWAGQWLGLYTSDQLGGFILATLGATVFVAAYRLIWHHHRGRRRTPASLDSRESNRRVA